MFAHYPPSSNPRRATQACNIYLVLQEDFAVLHTPVAGIVFQSRSPSFAMRILLAALLLPAVVALKTCVVDEPCDVCGAEEALFPIASSPFADTGICVSKKRWRPHAQTQLAHRHCRPYPLPSTYCWCLPHLVGASRHLVS